MNSKDKANRLARCKTCCKEEINDYNADEIAEYTQTCNKLDQYWFIRKKKQ